MNCASRALTVVEVVGWGEWGGVKESTSGGGRGLGGAWLKIIGVLS